MKQYDTIVTGAKGNIGSRVVEKLKKDVLSIDRHNWSRFENDDLYANNLVHCAFDLKNSYSLNPKQMIESNILSTGKVLELTKTKKIKKIIFISSCAVYGNSSDTREKAVCIPVSINGQVKLLNEKIIESYCLQNNIKFHILRVFNLFGGDDQFSVVSKILAAAKNKTPFNLNNDGLSQRDFVHVDDVCKIIEILIERNLDSSYLNVGTGKALKIIDLVNKVKNLGIKLDEIRTYHQECEYSRANLNQFSRHFKINFIDVFDYLEEKLKSDNAI